MQCRPGYRRPATALEAAAMPLNPDSSLSSSPHRMSPTQKHLLHFEGGNALSAFRAQALFLKWGSVWARIRGAAARHVHWVWTDSVVQPDATRKLASLLRYGDE